MSRGLEVQQTTHFQILLFYHKAQNYSKSESASCYTVLHIV